jgi:mannosyl-3-phosphoglycerate phosphatase family protein
MQVQKEKAVRIRPKRTAPPPANAPHLGVFTAVDGTLLDAHTFETGASRSVIERLHAAGVPVIPVSVMTLDELAPIASELGLRKAMIVEAGGAIARWSGGDWEVEACGPPVETLLDVIREIEDRSGASLRVYSVMPEPEASEVSGRSGTMLEASTNRRFSEPFVLESGELVAVERAAAAIGFSVRRGRRFLHLCRACDEGAAFVRLRDELQCDATVAVGGSPVDAEFLGHADVAIIVPGPNGRPDPELLARVPGARIAPAPAPDGWAAAVEEIWHTLTAPSRRVRRA